MNIAFLFNSDHDDFGGSYGFPIRQAVLDTGILQHCPRSKRFYEGDLLTWRGGQTHSEYKQFTLKILHTDQWSTVQKGKLEALLPHIVVCVFLIQNLSKETCVELDHKLARHDWYLGALQVDFSIGAYLVLFRNSLCEQGRLVGCQAQLFYSMSNEDECDAALEEQLSQSGFAVTHEDRGARRTIFDNFDSLEHFQRIADFENFSVRTLDLDEAVTSQCIQALEEIHPKLFETLFSAAKSLRDAQTSDEFAQAGLAARRFLKLLTDVWFPATDRPSPSGHILKDAHVKNRFRAHLEQNLELSSAEITELGKRFDKLWENASKYLHQNNATAGEAEELIREIVRLTNDVVSINPSKAVRPYTAYNEEMISFLRQAFSKGEKNDQ